MDVETSEAISGAQTVYSFVFFRLKSFKLTDLLWITEQSSSTVESRVCQV